MPRRGLPPRDPDGDLRANLEARLEFDLMSWSDRAAISYTEPEGPR